MRQRANGATTVLVAVLGLVLAGCSGDDGQEGPDVGSTGSSASPVAGTPERVSVASVTVPSALTFTREESSTEPDLDEVTWSAAASGSPVPVCRIILGVQSDFPGDMAAYRGYLRDVLRLTSIEDDPKAPEQVTGVLAAGAGGSGTPDDPSFRSALRTWVTPGRTKITVSVATADAAADACDPDAVVATLAWDGTERAATASASATPAT